MSLGDAWQDFLARNGANWSVLWNEYNATPNTLFGEGIVLANGPLTTEEVKNSSMRAIEDNSILFRVKASQLRLERAIRVDALVGDAIWHVTYNQVHEGVPIFGSRIDLTISDSGTLLLLNSEWLFPEIDISTKPAINEKQALEIVLKQITFDAASDQIDGELEIYPCSGEAIEPRLAWKVKASTNDPLKNWVYHIDATTGDLLHVWDGILYADVTGNVSGRGHRFDPLSGLISLPFGNIGVSGSGGAFGFTAANGNYNIFVGPNPATMTSNLGAGGLFARIINAAGGPLAVSATAPQPGPINLLFNPGGADEFATAQVDGYFHTNFVQQYLQDRLIPPAAGLNIQIPTTVNVNATCNAFYTGSAIRFFRAGGGCPNTAYDTIVYHEYGHFLDDVLGGIVNEALSEGIGDTAATFASSTLLGVDQPLIGENFFGAGNHLRTGTNNRQWPAPECGGEVHCVGEVYAGFTWNARRNMLNRGANVRVAEDLILNSLPANSSNIPNQVLQTFVTDVARYGGSLTTGSPNYYSICEAAVDKGFNSTAPMVIPVWADFGSAPAPYPSTVAANGARHRVICAEWLVVRSHDIVHKILV